MIMTRAEAKLQLTPAITDPAITDNPAITDKFSEIRYPFFRATAKNIIFFG
jgi:hypothetical protein